MKIIYTRDGREIKVDDADYDWLNSFTWCIDSYSYAKRSGPRKEGGKSVSMHRLIFGCAQGDGVLVDHINQDKLDNRRENLRVATSSTNQYNQGICKSNTSGFKGVSQNAKTKIWRAGIKIMGRSIYLGSYKFPEEAAHAYNKAAVKYHGEFAVLNPVGGRYDW